MKRLTAGLFVMFFLVMVGNGFAGIVTVDARSAFPEDDLIQWSQAGANNTFLSNPFTVQTFYSNIEVEVSMPNSTGSFKRLDQGGGWGGNFAPSDKLLFTQYVYDVIQLTFTTPVYGLGSQIQTNKIGDFTSYLEVFDASNTSLGRYDRNGVSTHDADNSAIFLGILSDTPIVSAVFFAETQFDEADPKGFAINKLSLKTGPYSGGDVVPEPVSLALFSIGIGAALLRRRK